ncbi:MAG TPA: hypothetical protein PK468_16500 [Candidatus Hydrogenedentes bacterium]|jgi:hypothetical protein|nr:hypothetical protein [Candidatus Hydrogenedentota bacterium]
MMDFMESTGCQFGNWALPMALRNESLGRFVSEHPDFDAKIKSAYVEWSRKARENLAQVERQLSTGYGMPELEMLRVEACFCIIQGHWQAAVCLTNILLEAFLKLALVYSNTDEPEEQAQPLSRLLNSLSAPVQKYMQMDLNDTINAARKAGLIDRQTKKDLHSFRERFRNAFFHADMQSMFGDQKTPVTGADFGTREIEHNEIAIRSLPLLLGETLWQNAQANAIPYFTEVDALIRETLPKVFPHMRDEQSEVEQVLGEQGKPNGELG